ncbi:MAG: SusD/RagB family nutrient-binding outer membrane lipoprotein [Prevotellaceae bacterium]|jgi:hypothetical protein|nr:SusD/RagB family nutrient-binding outer membrane lipoprotein [Prevotellaceae bacterium]
MKRINLFIIAIFSFALFSCSEDTMQKINEDKNHSTDVAARLIITDVINSTSFLVTGADFAFYASAYVEYNVGVYNQLYNAEIRVSEPTSSTTYNNYWGTAYSNLLNLREIIRKCSPGGDEEANTTVLGMAQVLSAYNLAILTDLFGDVPWTEALQPGEVWTPKLDKQEEIYVAVNQLLTDAISNLKKETIVPAIGTQDPIYGGSATKWLKFAYGLQARYAMRLSKVKPNYDAVIAAADNSFANASEEAFFKCSTIKNPFYLFFTDRDYFGASQSLHDKLVARNDPRDAVYFTAYPGTGDLIFAPNGTPQQKQGYYGISAITSPTAPIYLMSYHELEFLKAEAYARKGDLDNVKTHLKNAVVATFARVELTSDIAEAYYASNIEPRMISQAEAIKEVMLQKYLGLYEIESVETYNDIRRLKAMGEGSYIPLANTKNFPLRYTYGADDVTTNVNVETAYGDGSYVYTENVWWAGGSR